MRVHQLPFLLFLVLQCAKLGVSLPTALSTGEELAPRNEFGISPGEIGDDVGHVGDNAHGATDGNFKDYQKEHGIEKAPVNVDGHGGAGAAKGKGTDDGNPLGKEELDVNGVKGELNKASDEVEIECDCSVGVKGRRNLLEARNPMCFPDMVPEVIDFNRSWKPVDQAASKATQAQIKWTSSEIIRRIGRMERRSLQDAIKNNDPSISIKTFDSASIVNPELKSMIEKAPKDKQLKVSTLNPFTDQSSGLFTSDRSALTAGAKDTSAGLNLDVSKIQPQSGAPDTANLFEAFTFGHIEDSPNEVPAQKANSPGTFDDSGIAKSPNAKSSNANSPDVSAQKPNSPGTFDDSGVAKSPATGGKKGTGKTVTFVDPSSADLSSLIREMSPTDVVNMYQSQMKTVMESPGFKIQDQLDLQARWTYELRIKDPQDGVAAKTGLTNTGLKIAQAKKDLAEGGSYDIGAFIVLEDKSYYYNMPSQLPDSWWYPEDREADWDTEEGKAFQESWKDYVAKEQNWNSAGSKAERVLEQKAHLPPGTLRGFLRKKVLGKDTSPEAQDALDNAGMEIKASGNKISISAKHLSTGDKVALTFGGVGGTGLFLACVVDPKGKLCPLEWATG